MKERKLTPVEATAAEAVILQRMKATPTFTYMDLYSSGDKALGWQGTYRLADRLIQRERKAGRIRQTAKRGVWEVVR